MRNTKSFAVLAILICVLSACSKSNIPTSTTPALKIVDCWFDKTNSLSKATCYQVFVREDHNNDASPIINFPLVKLQSSEQQHSRKQQKTPVIDFGGGGPGGASGIGKDDIEWLVDIYKPFSLDVGRDLYLFEVRGTGLAKPKLTCDSQVTAAKKLWTSNLTTEQREQYDFDSFMSCIDELRNKGIEPLNYNSLAVAKDVEFIRQSLDIERFNLVGVSYASRYAQTYVREYSQFVDKIVLDGPVFPHIITSEDMSNDFNAFVNVFEKLSKDGFDSEGLQQQFFSFYERFNNQSLAVEVSWPLSQKAKTVYLSGSDFKDVLFNYLYLEDNYLKLPKIFNELQSGDPSELLEALEFSIFDSLDTSFSTIINISTYCYEEYPFLNKQEAQSSVQNIPALLHKDTYNDLDYINKTCEAVTQGKSAPVIEGRAIVTDKPTLLITGELDPVIPVSDTIEALENFTNGNVFVVKEASHFTLDDPCIQLAIASFWKAEKGNEDSMPCLADTIYTSPNMLLEK